MTYQEKLIMKFEKDIDKELTKLSEIENKDEKIYKLEVLYKMHKVLTNYEELEPLVERFFIEKARKEKFERGER